MDELSLDAEQRIDEVCICFEKLLQSGSVATIEAFLEHSTGAERLILLRELILLEVEHRVCRGEHPNLEEYRNRFPAHSEDVAKWFPSEATISVVPADSSPPKLVWPSLPGYEITAELGRGAMGVVYLARHVRFDRDVALKMMLANEHASAEQTQRFLVEARAVARLQHPNIVQIHEIGEHGSVSYFSLEYVDGDTLATWLRRTPPSDMEASRVVECLARTVHYAHGRGIVHRDLKPANILLTSDGVPKIADFGLAKDLSDENSATRTGVILGTASYMAPEQAVGKAKQVGPAVDIYALGAILYELLTGQPPFRGETLLETLRLVEEQTPLPPHVYNSRVDRALEAICLKCLQKSVADRYPTAEALADDLAAFQRGEKVFAHGGTATRLIGAVLRETRYIEVMRLWSGVWMGWAVMYFAVCSAKSILLWSDLASHASFLVIWLGMFITAMLITWFCRLRNGPRLSEVEKQILKLGSFFWVGFFLTAWQFQRFDGPIEVLLPILILQLGVVTGCLAVLLGGSFYVMAAACVFTAVLEAISPAVGSIISGIVCAPALFRLGWKYRSKA